VYSCSGSECKELLASLGWCELAQALDEPALVITLTKFRQRAAQFLGVLEHPDPQPLPLGVRTLIPYSIMSDRLIQRNLCDLPALWHKKSEALLSRRGRNDLRHMLRRETRSLD
jgi:hypothetical protein